jgi:hypothetical protein
MRDRATCTVGQLLDELPPEDADAIRQAVSSNVPYQTISSTLRGFGRRIQGQTISRHFRGVCNCDVPQRTVGTGASLSEALASLRS